MKAIWKYAINPHTTIQIPQGARLLSVQVQDNQPQLWALVDPAALQVGRMFQAVATGEEFDDDGMTYIDTFQINGGALVFHLFEVSA